MNTLRLPDIRLAVMVVFAVAGLVYTGQKIIPFHDAPQTMWDGFDFRQIWVAGKVWASGDNPYGEAFRAEYLSVFGSIPDIHFLLYPPYWAPIAVPLSFLPFGAALIIWRLVNLALLMGAVLLTARVIAGRDDARFWPLAMIGLGFTTLMQATALSVWIGQTSIPLFFGFAAIIYGFSRHNRWLFVIGLIAVALKPNAGAVVFLAVAMLPAWRWPLALAAGLLVLLAAPVLIHAPVEQVTGLLANLGRYYGSSASADVVVTEWARLRDGNYELIANAPDNMIGLFHFAGGLPSRLAANALVALGAVAAMVMFRRARNDELQFVALIMIVLLFVPLHAYDMVMLTIPAMFLWSLAPRMKAKAPVFAGFAGLLICLRPGNIAQALHIAPGGFLPESGPATVGLLLVAIPVLMWLAAGIEKGGKLIWMAKEV